MKEAIRAFSKVVLISLAILMVSAAVNHVYADTYVQGHYRSNGTYVQPHYRSSPDSTPYNNWSSKGNVNPYNGNRGYKNPYQQQRQVSPNYQSSPYRHYR